MFKGAKRSNLGSAGHRLPRADAADVFPTSMTSAYYAMNPARAKKHKNPPKDLVSGSGALFRPDSRTGVDGASPSCGKVTREASDNQHTR